MKRRFTILTAALALLTFLAVPMGMWGQTRTIQTASYGFETGDAGWTATSFATNNTAITAHGGSKYGVTNGGSTANVKYDALVANPQSLTCYYSKTTTNTNAGSHFEIQVSTNNSTWTKVAEGLGMDKVTKGTWYELTADLSSYSNVYVRVYYTGTSAVRALDDITLTYDDGQTPSTDPEISFTPASVTLGEVLVGNQASATFSVSQANLTSGITLSVDNGSLSPSSIAQGAAATTVTWTYTPTTAGAISATVTATSGTTTETLAISGTAIAPVEGYDVDFEYATNMYPNWTFNNMESYQTGSITAHGGTYYGTTGGKSTASIATTSTVANPGTLTCYVSKQSGNTTSSTWYIQVSENGSTWTDVETHSATSMSQGTWVEYTADLTDYTDVYVRVYYSGSTAVRNIDDLTLTTVTPSPAVATTTTINVPQGFNTDYYTATNHVAGTLTATVTESVDNTTISGASVTWESTNTSVATVDQNGEVTLVAVGSTTIKANYAGVENVYRPSTGTYELTVTSSEPIPGTETDPYTVAEARTFIDGLGGETSGEVYVTGIISQIDSYNSSYHSITYWISDDGTTTNQLEVYSGKGLNGANFSSVNDLIVGSTVTVKGNLKKYNDVYEFNYNSEIVSLTPPAQYTLTNAMSNVEDYHVFVGNEEVVFENNQAQVSAGATVYVSLTMQDCYALNSLTVNGSTTGVTEEEPGVYYSFVMPEGNATIAVSSTQATQYTLTVVGGENVTFDLLAGAGSIPVLLTNGTASICEQLFVTIANLTANSGLVLQSVTLTAGGSTTTLTLDNGVYHFNMPSNNATLTFTTDLAPVADNYELFSGALVEGDYIIYYDGYAMKNTVVNNRLSYETVTPSNDVISTADATIVWHIAPSGEYWTIFSADAEAYAASTGSKNQARMLSDGTSDNALWTVTGTATYEFENKARAASSSNSGNKWLRNNGTNGFACYANSTGGALSLYKKVEATETYTLTINGYTDVAEGEGTNNKGYYLIASPVTVDPATAGMTTGNFDLYYFNQAETDEWRNYENASFNLVPGTGYLYAKEGANQTFNFTLTGAPYDGDGEIELRNTTGAEFEGWNLVGNPYGVEAEISMDYYEMNSDRSGLIAGENYIIDAMQGVFVKYSEEDQTVIFMPAETGTASGGESKLALNLTKGRGVIDRAIVRFGEGRQLPKFQLNQDDTKVYITEGNQDYAIVPSNNAGDMPVSFKAAENGNYTLSVEAENVEASYLHLIDNMTGADVDLLATPSYSFEARTTDYANRFRLVFNANGVDENNATASFAYFNGSSWTVSNMGEATLQVVDMMGRVVSTQAISGNTEVNLNQVPGIYMLRLVNGENVMVQKVVVR